MTIDAYPGPALPPGACGAAEPGPWSRKKWLGSLTSSNPPQWVGVTEHDKVATSMDVIIDIGQSDNPAAAVLYFAIYSVSHVGGRVYRAQYNQTGGETAIPSGHAVTFPGKNCIVSPSGKQFVVQASAAAGALWGIELASLGTFGARFSNIMVTSIVHGREA